jgi:hypothetical protein
MIKAWVSMKPEEIDDPTLPPRPADVPPLVHQINVPQTSRFFSFAGKDFRIRVLLLCDDPAVYRVIAELVGENAGPRTKVYEKGYVSSGPHNLAEDDALIAQWVREAREKLSQSKRKPKNESDDGANNE